jgi:hypothetical protein
MPAGVNESRWAKARRIADASPSAPKQRYTKQYWAYVRGIYNNMSSGDEPTDKEAGMDEQRERGFMGRIGDRLSTGAASATGAALRTRPGQAFLDALLDRAVYRPDIGYGPGMSYAERVLQDPAAQDAAVTAARGWLAKPGNKSRAMSEVGGAVKSYAGRKAGEAGDWIQENPGKATGIAAMSVAIPYLLLKMLKGERDDYGRV